MQIKVILSCVVIHDKNRKDITTLAEKEVTYKAQTLGEQILNESEIQQGIDNLTELLVHINRSQASGMKQKDQTHINTKQKDQKQTKVRSKELKQEVKTGKTDKIERKRKNVEDEDMRINKRAKVDELEQRKERIYQRAFRELTEEVSEQVPTDITIEPKSLNEAFHKAMQKEYKGICAWYTYGKRFSRELGKIRISKPKCPENMLRQQVYEKINYPGITPKAVRMRTIRAEMVYKLFSQIGEEKLYNLKTVTPSELVGIGKSGIERLIEEINSY